MKHFVAPSILSSDFSHISKEIGMISNSCADWIHVDIMDGVFVPNITIGLPIVRTIKKYTTKPLDVHLMITSPERYIKAFYDAGASIISVHIEADIHLHRTVHLIKELGCQASVALNPHTPVSWLEDIVNDIDIVCIMAVNPGFGGQQLIQNTYEKIKKLKHMIHKKKVNVRIEVDGGVDITNAGALIDEGADILVSGHFVFSSPVPTQAIEKLSTIR